MPRTVFRRGPGWGRRRLASLAVALAALAPRAAGAQADPARPWRTIRTAHFRVHFTPELEDVARRSAVIAESAYVRLSRHLPPPRGGIDLLIADNVDFTNGYATPFPSNRIVLYAAPPAGDETLRFVDDHIELVTTHELTHVFHLDQSRGIWRPLRGIFGRDPRYLPNLWQPAWLTEGLAVYYESLITGSGRLEGSNHRMIGRSAANAREFPRIHQLSLASPRFPYGYSAYAFGSLFVDHLAREHGDSAMRRLVQASSGALIPLWLNRPARRAFHTSFTAAYTRWADSLRQVPAVAGPVAGWRDLTVHRGFANVPRWLDDSTLIYDGTSGRESYAAYRLRLRTDTSTGSWAVGPGSTQRTRLARRNSRSPNVLLPDSSLLFAQLEYRSPYDIRSDLYRSRPGGGTRRLTRGARLSHPDARADGLIVVMQTIPAGTRLALVSADGRHIVPITDGGPDEQWTEPRWSPDGRHIAAVRWTRGGTSAMVVVDTGGRVVQIAFAERAVVADPAWSPDGRVVYFSSDRTGITDLYRVAFRPETDSVAAPPVERLTATSTGLFEPQPSPDGRALAAVAWRADGYHVGITPLDSLQVAATEPIDSVAPRTMPPAARDEGPATRYSPWRLLLPRFWVPFSEAALDSGSARLGAYTSGSDIAGRHEYQALLFVPTDGSGLTGAFAYRNARLGSPVVDLAGSQERENFRCIADATQQNTCIGFLRRRIRDASLALTLNRFRYRTSAYLSLGGGVEVRDYATDPAGLIDRIDSLYRHTLYYPRVSLSAGWSNMQHPQLSISPEDGVSLALTSRFRWRKDRPTFAVRAGPDTVDRRGDAVSIVTAASAYKSLPLPGFGHHVLALRAAGGWVDSRNSGYLEVGGVSGGTLEVLPGYNLGEGRRTFPIRGFPPAAMIGMRAYAISAEYRAPLWLPGRGLGLWPAFFDRTNIAFFGDLGSAWCPGIFRVRPAPAFSLCTQGDYDIGRNTQVSRNPIVYADAYNVGSVGAELNVNAAILGWDSPYRYRFGIARPLIGRDLLGGVAALSTYFAIGIAF